MSFLPSLHPALTLHLFDQTLTPILSSATTVPSDSDGSRAAATTSLSRSALAAYSSALRLDMGAPVRIMVECELPNAGGQPGGAGPVALSSFIEPTDPAAGRGEGTPGSGSRSSGTTVGGRTGRGRRGGSRDEYESRRDEEDDEDDDDDDPRRGRTLPRHKNSSRTYGNAKRYHNRSDGEGSGTSFSSSGSTAAPTLFGLVVAPDAVEHGPEARRAGARLERVAREFQTAWAEEQRRGGEGQE